MRIGTLIGYELDNTYEFHGGVEPMIFNFPTGKFTKTGESTPQISFLSFWGRKACAKKTSLCRVEAPHFSSEKSSFSLVNIIQPGSFL